METGDGVLAWRVLRHVGDYADAWARHGAKRASHSLEPGPFRIRVQDRADLEAMRFELLAWEDPADTEGPASPFWHQDEMLEGFLDPNAEPLAAMAAQGCAFEGLRLLGGDLVLKIESAGAAVQVRLRDAALFPDGCGISVRHVFGLRMPHSMRCMLDFWSVARRPGPPKGRARPAGNSRRTGCCR